MEEEIKCPQCGGNKYQKSDAENYKCMYCGTSFSIKKEVPLPPSASKPVDSTSTNVTVNVDVSEMQQKFIQAQRKALKQETEERNEEQRRGCERAFGILVAGLIVMIIFFKGCF